LLESFGNKSCFTSVNSANSIFLYDKHIGINDVLVGAWGHKMLGIIGKKCIIFILHSMLPIYVSERLEKILWFAYRCEQSIANWCELEKEGERSAVGDNNQ
jgi:hypothetical protein